MIGQMPRWVNNYALEALGPEGWAENVSEYCFTVLGVI
jgi:hypothetical protein